MSPMGILTRLGVVLAMVLATIGGSARAATVAFDAGGDGTDWFDASNWNPNAVPADGDDVTIGSGFAVVLTNSTLQLSSFSIVNSTLTFSNWTTCLNATNVTIQNAGELTTYVCDTNGAPSNTNRVYVSCSNLTIDAGGEIDVKWKGYAGTSGNGQGPGGGVKSGVVGGGGGYGARGNNRSAGFGGPAYGSATAPLDPGSAGGAGSVNGGAGGGAVRVLATGRVTVDGAITAIGQNAGSAGGGSGGGVYISCNTFQGSATGLISADAGNVNNNGGGGAGGRIAVVYDTSAQSSVAPTPSVRFSVGGGNGYSSDTLAPPGTLFLSDASFFSPETLSSYDLSAFLSFTNWAPASVTGNQAWVVAPNLEQVAVGNGMALVNSRLDLSNVVMNVGGDLLISNDAGSPQPLAGGQLRITAGATNGTSAFGAEVKITGDMFVTGSAKVYPISHPSNGGSVSFQMKDLTIGSSATFNADGSTASGGFAGGGANQNGFGPGMGKGSVDWATGGGYGGAGGGSAAPYGVTNGSATAPLGPGSGGGGSDIGPAIGGYGGGLARIDASGTVTVNGTIGANGRVSGGKFAGGGSGGGIYITCDTITGGGTIRAEGGDNPSTGYTGGGGRIAVHFDFDTTSGITTNVDAGKQNNGTGGSGNAGAGTIVWAQIPVVAGTVILIK